MRAYSLSRGWVQNTLMTANVKILDEVGADWTTDGGWRLWLQWCEYRYSDAPSQMGYRFIWRRPNGSLQPGRGQARLPSLTEIEKLLAKARAAGWGHNTDGEESSWNAI